MIGLGPLLRALDPALATRLAYECQAEGVLDYVAACWSRVAEGHPPPESPPSLRDPWGRPWRFSMDMVDGALVYSVGPNGADDGWGEGDDFYLDAEFLESVGWWAPSWALSWPRTALALTLLALVAYARCWPRCLRPCRPWSLTREVLRSAGLASLPAIALGWGVLLGVDWFFAARWPWISKQAPFLYRWRTEGAVPPEVSAGVTCAVVVVLACALWRARRAAVHGANYSERSASRDLA